MGPQSKDREIVCCLFQIHCGRNRRKSYLNVVARDEEGGPADHDEETARDVVSDDVVRDLPLDDNPEGIIDLIRCWSKERFLGCVNPILRTDSRHEGNFTQPREQQSSMAKPCTYVWKESYP